MKLSELENEYSQKAADKSAQRAEVFNQQAATERAKRHAPIEQPAELSLTVESLAHAWGLKKHKQNRKRGKR